MYIYTYIYIYIHIYVCIYEHLLLCARIYAVSSGTTHNFSIASTTETEFVEFFKTDEMDEADDVPT